MATTGESSIKVPECGFFVEIEGLGNLNLESFNEVPEEDPRLLRFVCTRVLDLDNKKIREWWHATNIREEKKSGLFHFMKAGMDVGYLALSNVKIREWSFPRCNALSKDVTMKERFVLTFDDFDTWVVT